MFSSFLSLDVLFGQEEALPVMLADGYFEIDSSSSRFERPVKHQLNKNQLCSLYCQVNIKFTDAFDTFSDDDVLIEIVLFK